MVEDAMQQRRFLLSDKRRQRLRDDCLWTRELQRVRFFNQKSLHCPCSRCKGRRRWLLATIKDHLIRNGRHLDFRVWRGLGDQDSSDEEWEEDFWTPTVHRREDVDPLVDTCQMVEDAFCQADMVLDAFTVANEVYVYCVRNDNASQSTDDMEVQEPIGESDSGDTGEDEGFDP
jgi:hypothetical protein